MWLAAAACIANHPLFVDGHHLCPLLVRAGELSLAEAREKLASWRGRLAAMHARQKALVPGLEIFEVALPDQSTLTDIGREVEELEVLWGLAEQWGNDWKTWKNGAFAVLDVTAMEDSAARYRQRLMKMREMRGYGAWQTLEARIKEFMATLPLIQALGNPALRERHWLALKKEIGLAFDHTADDFTLEKIMQYGFGKHAEYIDELSSNANKELAIETALADIKAVWGAMVIDIAAYKNDYWKIRSTDDLFQQLEDHTVSVTTMKASPYYPAFAADLDYWESTLSAMAEIIDLQLTVQRQWMYLESIFMASADIRKMLAAEASIFDGVNASYASIMNRIHDNPNAVIACTHPGYLALLESMDEKLQAIQKALDQYLESKRQQFPRFYFLSNDDLLEMLGQSKEPAQVQKHIKKCFEGIQTLQLLEPGAPGGGKTHEAVGMVSPDGERVPFERKVVADGPVEVWLLDTERCMRLALAKILGA